MVNPQQVENEMNCQLQEELLASQKHLQEAQLVKHEQNRQFQVGMAHLVSQQLLGDGNSHGGKAHPGASLSLILTKMGSSYYSEAYLNSFELVTITAG